MKSNYYICGIRADGAYVPYELVSGYNAARQVANDLRQDATTWHSDFIGIKTTATMEDVIELPLSEIFSYVMNRKVKVVRL